MIRLALLALLLVIAPVASADSLSALAASCRATHEGCTSLLEAATKAFVAVDCGACAHAARSSAGGTSAAACR